MIFFPQLLLGAQKEVFLLLLSSFIFVTFFTKCFYNIVFVVILTLANSFSCGPPPLRIVLH